MPYGCIFEGATPFTWNYLFGGAIIRRNTVDPLQLVLGSITSAVLAQTQKHLYQKLKQKMPKKRKIEVDP